MRKGILALTDKTVHKGEDPELIQRLFTEELKFREYRLGILGNQLFQILQKEEQEKNVKESKK